MGDFDPCECINILNHEGRMQRLLHLLRNSQSECTDNECFTSADGSDGLGLGGLGGTQSTYWTFILGWLFLVIVLYFMRPARRRTGDLKGNNSGPGNGNGGGNDPAPVY